MSILAFSILGPGIFLGCAKAPIADSSSGSQLGKLIKLESVEIFWRYNKNESWESATKAKRFVINNEDRIKVLAQLSNLSADVKDMSISAILKQGNHQRELKLTEPAEIDTKNQGLGTISGLFLMSTSQAETWLKEGLVTIIVQVKAKDKIFEQTQELQYSTAE